MRSSGCPWLFRAMRVGKALLKKLKPSNNMRDPGIEPGSHRWQRYILPLDQSRSFEQDESRILWTLWGMHSCPTVQTFLRLRVKTVVRLSVIVFSVDG